MHALVNAKMLLLLTSLTAKVSCYPDGSLLVVVFLYPNESSSDGER